MGLRGDIENFKAGTSRIQTKNQLLSSLVYTQRVSKVGILAKAGAWEFKSAWRRRSSACQVAGPMQPDLKA